MARTAPVPNFAAIPGMNPGIFVLGGGGAGGGSGPGGGKGGAGKQGAGGKNGGKDAKGGGKNAPDPQKFPHCGTESHPVDFSNGRAFTHPIPIVSLPGPLPLEISRSYSSTAVERDVGLGRGWSHDLGYRVEERRRSIVVWTGLGTSVSLDVQLEPGEETIADFSYRVRREAWGYIVDPNDGKIYHFAERDADEAFLLTAVVDRNGNRIALRYEAGRLAEVEDSAGRIVRFRPDSRGRIAAIECKNAAQGGQWVAFESYDYDEAGNLVRATDAEGYPATYAYDDEHRLTEDTDRTGLCFHFRYDAEGRCFEAWGDYPGRGDPSLDRDVPAMLASGGHKAKGVHHCVFEYLDGATHVIDSRNLRTFDHNELGLLTQSADGPRPARAAYDDRGFLIAQENSDGSVERMERDGRGNLLSYLDPLGGKTEWERDAHGLAVSVTGPLGHTTRLERDARGNPTRYVDALGQSALYSHDERGLLVSSTTAGGATCRYAYDVQGNLTQVLLSNGRAWQFRYDHWGRLAECVDPAGVVTRYAFSTRGDLLAVHDALGGVTRYHYDGERHKVAVEAPNGAFTELYWGGYHRLVGRKNANGEVLRLAYDREGDLVRVINEKGEEHSIVLDTWGNAVEERTFDGRVLRYRVDELGRPVRITRGEGPGAPAETVHTDLAYDAMDRVVKISFGDEIETFVHDAEGNLLEASSGQSQVVFHRDPLGRIVRETQTIGDETYEVACGYDAHDFAIERRTSLGHAETIARDVSGARIRTVLDGSLRWDHLTDGLGREASRKLPRGGCIETSFDPLGRMLEKRAFGPSRQLPRRPGEPSWLGPAPDGLTAQSAYHYDAGGDLIAKFERARGTTEYEHDRTGQLLRAEREGRPREVFTYGAAGDLFEGDRGDPRSYEPGGRLARKGQTAYVWDANGRLVERREPEADGSVQVWRYTWSEAGRLTRVESPGGDAVELTYDALSRRTSKRSLVWDEASRRRKLARETRFVWDQHHLVHEITRRIHEDAAERGDPVSEVRTFCFEDGSHAPTAHREPDGQWVHYLTDPVGTPEQLVDDTGVVVGELVRDAFRLSPAKDSAVRTPLRFPGQYEDEETGLCYNRYRYYDPGAGMYLSPDPLGLVGGYHAYRYGMDPLLWMDPFGLVFAKKYSLEEVQQTLAESEGRNSPTTGKPAHAGSEHVQVPKGKLQKKSCKGTKTSFSSCKTQAQAVQAALNSAEGQKKLAELDADPNLKRVEITAPLPHPVTISKSVKGGKAERVQATQTTVIVDRLPTDEPHVQTAFGS
jgi:RHS repeat-associated protein